MIIDSTGVGIGTSSPSQVLHLGGASNKTVQVTSSTSNAGYFGVYQDTVGLTVNRDHSDGTFADTGKTEAAIVLQSQNANSFITFKTTSTNNTESTERMRIDKSGKVGIGTSSPDSILHIEKPSGNNTYLQIKQAGVESWQVGMTASSTALSFLNSGSERMRIDSTGDIRFGCTGAQLEGSEVFSFANGQRGNTIAINTVGSAAFFGIDMQNQTGGTCKQIRFRSGGSATTVGSITSTGNNATQYNTSSDYRLKENVAPIQNGLTRLQQLNPVQFDWKNSGETSEGFIAHEVQEIFSDAVIGEKDAEEMQGMDYGRITPLLVKAIQEQQTIIDDLKTRIETLENV